MLIFGSRGGGVEASMRGPRLKMYFLDSGRLDVYATCLDTSPRGDVSRELRRMR